MHVRCLIHFDGTDYQLGDGSTPGVAVARVGTGELRLTGPEPLPDFVDVFGAELVHIAPDRRSILVRRLGRRGVAAEDGDLSVEVVEAVFLPPDQVAYLAASRRP